jgi:hypothetical protein
MGKKKTGARRVKVKRRQLLEPFAGGLWDFWRDGVTQSFLSTWSGCMEEARLRYVEGWTDRRVSEALEFGNVFHYALSEFYHGKAKVPTAKRIVNVIEEYRDAWLNERKVVSSSEEETMEKVLALAEPSLCGYVTRWAGDWDGRYKLGCATVKPKKWLASEQRFRVPFEFADGKQAYLNGMFDGVFEDAKGGIWLLETKTKSRIDEEGIAAGLSIDRQVNLYLHALHTMYGKKVRGVLYNVVRRPGNRLGKSETLGAFSDRVGDDIVAKLGSGHHFIRWELRLSLKETAAWFNDYLVPVMDDVRAWWEGRRPHYTNPDALFTKYGKSSMFNPIVSGDFSGHFRRSRAFNELPDVEG